MNRTCPKCHAANVRRSSTAAADRTWRNHLFSRYRCRECLAQFWVISRKTYAAVAGFVGAIVLVVIGVFVLESVFSRQSAPPRKRSEAAPSQLVNATLFPAPTGYGSEPPRVALAFSPTSVIPETQVRP